MLLLIASLFKKQNIFLNVRQKIKENIKDIKSLHSVLFDWTDTTWEAKLFSVICFGKSE